jgi:hypothetical protein
MGNPSQDELIERAVNNAVDGAVRPAYLAVREDEET